MKIILIFALFTFVVSSCQRAPESRKRKTIIQPAVVPEPKPAKGVSF